MKIVEYFRQSAKEVKNLYSLMGAALIEALGPILAMFTIVVNQYLQIGFSSLTHAMVGLMYGPVMGLFAGGVADIVKFIIKPTGRFFPGFTLNEMLVGFLYGLFFYKKEITWPRVVIARLIITFGINLTLTPLWLSIMYGNAFKFMVPVRLMKNLLMMPFDMVILYTVLKFVDKNIRPRVKKEKKPVENISVEE